MAEALSKVCGLPRVAVEDEDAVIQALTWLAEGLDFADALHLASSQSAESFCLRQEARYGGPTRRSDAHRASLKLVVV